MAAALVLTGVGAEPEIPAKSLRGSDHQRVSRSRIYRTEKVIVVVIDGVRNTEAFEDSAHRYIPHLWNDLRPRGTIYTNFYCTGIPSTSSAKTTMASGRRQGYRTSLYHLSEEPTIFEHYREQLNIPQDDTWIFMNYHYRDYDGDIYASEHPAFGEPYGARAYWGYNIRDEQLAAGVDSVMMTYHPSLITVWFKDVDRQAHTGVWERYLNALRIADELVYDIWLNIQKDPFYADRTTLIVTTDHGRHDDEHGGFIAHGDYCHGCRHLFFLTIGPDIRAGEVVEKHANQIDIAPTIAELLGFSMPMSEGHVLFEMFQERRSASAERTKGKNEFGWTDGATRLTVSSTLSKDPAIVGFDSTYHVAWLERDDVLTRDSWEVWHTTTDDFNQKSLLFGDSTGCQAPMWISTDADDETGVYVGIDYRRSLFDTLSADSTYCWGIGGMRREGVIRWSDFEEIVPAEFTAFPKGNSLAMDGGVSTLVDQANIGYSVVRAIRNSPSSDWLWSMETTGLSNYVLCEYPQIDVSNRTWHLTWISFRVENPLFTLQPYYFRFNGLNDRHVSPLGSQSDNCKRHMRLKTEDDLLIACWSEWENDRWEVYWQRSSDGGLTWLEQPALLSSSLEGAWRPDVAIYENTVHVVWEDYRDGNAEIYYKTSPNGGVDWSADQRVTVQKNYSIRPRVAASNNGAYVVWQDFRDGNWEIYGLQL